jgi:hypothetical protein
VPALLVPVLPVPGPKLKGPILKGPVLVPVVPVLLVPVLLVPVLLVPVLLVPVVLGLVVLGLVVLGVVLVLLPVLKGPRLTGSKLKGPMLGGLLGPVVMPVLVPVAVLLVTLAAGGSLPSAVADGVTVTPESLALMAGSMLKSKVKGPIWVVVCRPPTQSPVPLPTPYPRLATKPVVPVFVTTPGTPATHRPMSVALMLSSWPFVRVVPFGAWAKLMALRTLRSKTKGPSWFAVCRMPAPSAVPPLLPRAQLAIQPSLPVLPARPGSPTTHGTMKLALAEPSGA